MAQKQSGGVGAFGWTLLGFLAGVAATLAIQLIMVGRPRSEEPEESARHAPVVSVTPKLPAPKPKPKKTEAAASAAPPKIAAAEADQVAEDAAATGMTTRARPKSDTPQ
ncbi:hypothetical protein [Phenylobacterium montanum]|uniref:Uncharacterized protein n=1 Tax=Phenylobacterium montanum TaxID=2823693 RepID=A0A975IVS6_9CAUL|nr:hypothetical protein [Caulobacter sp. S6]QUD87646.1 hypothetical protein KCG34_21790 [Caulobacter sp. S6]